MASAVAAAASSGPSFPPKQHTFSTHACEVSCKLLPSSSSSDGPRSPRLEWSLGLEKFQLQDTCSASPRSLLNNSRGSSSNPELSNFKQDDFNGSKGRRRASRRWSGTANAVASDDYTDFSGGNQLFNVQDPRGKDPPWRGRVFDANQAWAVLQQDLQYCDWKARRDVLTIKNVHDKVVEVLNPMARDWKSIAQLREELAGLQMHLKKAHKQVHVSEARVSRSLEKLSEMEAQVNKMLPQITHSQSKGLKEAKLDAVAVESVSTKSATVSTKLAPHHRKSHGLVVSGPLQEYSPSLKNFWYPVAFTDDIKDDTMVPFEMFEEPWVLFRGQDGRVGCVRNSCAHRACPLHLGEVKDGRIQCPYHGWEYSTSGVCEKMPSTKPVSVRIEALPCVEHDGMVWIWAGDGVPDADLPMLTAPPGYTTHAQIVMELPVEHGLLMENLLDLAHAPFTHTSTFAKGWPVPSLVKFCTPVAALQGYWDPYPIDMEFQPPCMVRSTIGISKPGKLEGRSTKDCAKHLHQLHVCLPSSRGKTRLLYRLSLDFLPVLKHIPYIQSLWKYLANKVLDEDLRLVVGQQERMIWGANVWNLPVSYDKLGVRYRNWRMAIEKHRDKQPVNLSNSNGDVDTGATSR